MTKVVLLTGCNLGDKHQNIHRVAEIIEEEIGEIISASIVHESEAWGFDSPESFLNQALLVETDMAPNDLLFRIWSIEKKFGRHRGTPSEEIKRWNDRQVSESPSYDSRYMDIDIISYGNEVINTKLLIVPHPFVHKRKFALIPISEIASEVFLPACKKSVSEALLDIINE